MLPDLTASEMEILSPLNPEGAHKALLAMRTVFHQRSTAHLASTRIFSVFYHFFGAVASLLSVVLGSLDTCANSRLIFGMALTIAILTTVLNFFGIEGRMQKHNLAKNQYDSLGLEIEKHMMTSQNAVSDAVSLERSIFDRAKMIAIIEPDLSLCCLRSKE